MTFRGFKTVALPLLFAAGVASWISTALAAGERAAVAAAGDDDPRVEVGKRMYMEGLLPSGELMSGTVLGDVKLSGEQVICVACHRRSGLGSTEGQETVPAVTGNLLYEPLRLPTSRPPLAPMLRPAYTDNSLKRAIRDGIGADGAPLGALMPRYALTDDQLNSLIDYLKTLKSNPAIGVTAKEMHFATVVSDAVDPATRKAFLDVLETFFEQKNSETRHESDRAAHAPWHKAWVFKPYRKWALHVWELDGPRESWPEQLRSKYEKQPVFAVISGLATGSWQPIHDFCEAHKVPCLFPSTDLPVVNKEDFYSVYFSRGMALEADAVAQHLSDDGLISDPLVQVYLAADPRAQAAAVRLRDRLDRRGGHVTDLIVSDSSAVNDRLRQEIAKRAEDGTAVLWLDSAEIGALWSHRLPGVRGGAKRVYLSTTLFGTERQMLPGELEKRIYLVHPSALPSQLPSLLARSTGWLRAKGIAAQHSRQIQANAFFALKIAGEGVQRIRGFFNREYFLERIEHMAENATYTSVYPRVSLAPGQRFVSRGAYIAHFEPDGDGALVAVTDWLVPGSK